MSRSLGRLRVSAVVACLTVVVAWSAPVQTHVQVKAVRHGRLGIDPGLAALIPRP